MTKMYETDISARGGELTMTIQGTKFQLNPKPDMPTFSATEARNNFSDMFDQAHYGGGVLIEKRGRRVAVVPLEVLDRLAELEALIDTADAKRALEEFHKTGGTTLGELEKELDDD